MCTNCTHMENYQFWSKSGQNRTFSFSQKVNFSKQGQMATRMGSHDGHLTCAKVLPTPFVKCQMGVRSEIYASEVKIIKNLKNVKNWGSKNGHIFAYFVILPWKYVILLMYGHQQFDTLKSLKIIIIF